MLKVVFFVGRFCGFAESSALFFCYCEILRSLCAVIARSCVFKGDFVAIYIFKFMDCFVVLPRLAMTNLAQILRISRESQNLKIKISQNLPKSPLDSAFRKIFAKFTQVALLASKSLFLASQQ
ncbi:hypothetical protein, partial [Helicobacter sp. 23-1045]